VSHLACSANNLVIDTTIVMNPGGRKLGSGTPDSVNELIEEKTDELIKLVKGGNTEAGSTGRSDSTGPYQIIVA
jgi:hypothetical protein